MDWYPYLCTRWLKTGCANAGCAGFQPEKGAPIAPGGVIQNVTQPMGLKQNITIKIIKVHTPCVEDCHMVSTLIYLIRLLFLREIIQLQQKTLE
jgi:hypothetical protein